MSTASNPVFIQSRDNALVKDLRRLMEDGAAYRKQGRVWLEGDHLCRAALARGKQPAVAVFSESFWQSVPMHYAQAAIKNIVIEDALYASLSPLPSPAPFGFLMDFPVVAPRVLQGVAAVVLDRVQDAGNVGSILRSASAFGFGQVIAIKGSAALWSSKVLRAGMGAHFALHLVENASIDDVQALDQPMLVTSSHQGDWLHRAQLPWPCTWVMGHEGQGVSEVLQAGAQKHIRIVQPGGEESLNVGAAAAICLHASAASRAV
ncbi:MAG: RNA methyltransferase [Comamonas sp.]